VRCTRFLVGQPGAQPHLRGLIASFRLPGSLLRFLLLPGGARPPHGGPWKAYGGLPGPIPGASGPPRARVKQTPENLYFLERLIELPSSCIHHGPRCKAPVFLSGSPGARPPHLRGLIDSFRLPGSLLRFLLVPGGARKPPWRRQEGARRAPGGLPNASGARVNKHESRALCSPLLSCRATASTTAPPRQASRAGGGATHPFPRQAAGCPAAATSVASSLPLGF